VLYHILTQGLAGPQVLRKCSHCWRWPLEWSGTKADFDKAPAVPGDPPDYRTIQAFCSWCGELEETMARWCDLVWVNKEDE